VIELLKTIMRENEVKQLVLVDDGCPGLMVHINRKDFTPGKDNAVRSFPGPWLIGER
jgi:hypothetical protein